MLTFVSRFKYLYSGSWLLFEQVLRVLISTGYILFLATYLGPNDFGIFVFALTLMGIIKVFINFGAEDILVKLVATDPLNFVEYLSTAFYLKVFINFIFLIIFSFIYFLGVNESFLLEFLIILISLNFFSAFEVIGHYYESIVEGKKIAFCKLAQLTCVTIFKIYLLLGQYELIYFIFAFGLEFFLLGIFYCISFRKHIKAFLFNSFKINKYKNMISESYGYLIIGIIGVLFIRVDQLMVKGLLDYEQLGYFGLSARFTDVLFILAVIFAKTIFPLMIEKSNNEAEYKNLLKNIFTGVVWFCAVLSLLILFLGNYVIKNYFPRSEYIISFNVLTIYIWALIPYFFNQITYRWLMIKNKVRDNFIRLFIALILNFILNFALIPIFGIYGAAVSTLISLIFVSMLLDITFKYSMNLFFYKLHSFNPLRLYNMISRNSSTK